VAGRGVQRRPPLLPDGGRPSPAPLQLPLRSLNGLCRLRPEAVTEASEACGGASREKGAPGGLRPTGEAQATATVVVAAGVGTPTAAVAATTESPFSLFLSLALFWHRVSSFTRSPFRLMGTFRSGGDVLPFLGTRMVVAEAVAEAEEADEAVEGPATTATTLTTTDPHAK